MSSGRLESECTGQLALMDAMVFFAVALAVCSATLGYLDDGAADADRSQRARADPSAVLEVFMSCSLGSPVSLDGLVSVELTGREKVCECILAEAWALESGADIGRFSDLNSVIMGALRSICAPGYVPHLVVYVLDEASEGPLMVIEDHPAQAPDRRAASTVLAGPDGGVLLVSLVLEPASSGQL